MEHLTALASLVAVAAVTTGCLAATDRYTTGWVTLDWTIASQHDAQLCARHGAATMDIAIYDEAQRAVAHATPSCASFGTTVELDTGRYHAVLVLLDDRGAPVSTALTVAPFSVWHRQSVRVTTNFPDSVFP